VKAGGLREAAPANRFVTLILSDVLGNDPRTIASGPTVAAEREGRAALEVVDHFGVRELLPEGVVRTLAMAAPRREPVHCSQDILRIIGDNATAVMAAAREAERRGLRVDTRWRAVEGEAADLGRAWVAEAAEASESVDIMLGGGEATVTVRGDGLGGRNTEFALAAALELERRSMGGWVIASLATDGQDALTGMAGAIADAGTCERARRRGVDPELALARNDSLAAFVAAGGAVDTGPTGTNVNDLYSAVRARRMREAE
jgi:hydroxypyruvate reductase